MPEENGGGGIAVWGSDILVDSNIIRNNATGKYGSPAGGGEGGGIFVFNGYALVVNNLIYGNTSNLDGGGVAVRGLGTILLNNTIVDNAVVPVTSYSQVVDGGEQVYLGNYPLTLSNNVISGNSQNASLVCFLSGGTLFSHNDIYNALGKAVGSPAGTAPCAPLVSAGNLSVLPEFSAQATQNYHLAVGSPLIDTGDTSALKPVAFDLTITTDLDGNPRIQNATGAGCIVDIGAYEYPSTSKACSTTETLTSSLNPSTYGQTVTFTAQLSSATGTPSGNIQFTDGSTILGTQTISSTGASTFTTANLAIGTHNITATYQPTGTFSATSAALSQVVNGYATNTSLTCNPLTIPIFTTALLSATVTSSSGTPTGTINFTDNGVALSTQPLLSGGANLTYTGATAGTHTLTATYIPTGSFTGGSASCTEAITLLPSISTLAAIPLTSTYGTPIQLTATVANATQPAHGIPTGTVTFTFGSTTLGTAHNILGSTTSTAQLNNLTLPAGADTITCTYSGDDTYATSPCSPITLTITPAATAVTLTSTPNPAYFGQNVTLTAAVTSLAGPVASGRVTFYDANAATTLGTASVNPAGQATLTTNALAIGTHPLTAVYNLSTNFAASLTSAVDNQIILPSDFTIALAPSTVSRTGGQTATSTVQLTSIGNFSGPLALTFGALPANASATLAPGTVSLTPAGAATSLFTLVTQSRAQASIPPRPGTRNLAPILAATLLALPWLVTRRRRTFRRLLLVLVAATIAASATGCTNRYFTVAVVAPGSYTIPITATDTDGRAHTANLTVTIAP